MAKFKKGDNVKHTKQGEFGYPRSRGTVEDPNWTGGMIGVRWADGSFDSIDPSELKTVKESAIRRTIREELKLIISEAEGQYLGVYVKGSPQASIVGFRPVGKAHTQGAIAGITARKVAAVERADTKVIESGNRYYVYVRKVPSGNINEMSQSQIKKITQIATDRNQKKAVTSLAKLETKDLREYRKMVQRKISETYRAKRTDALNRWQFVDKVVGAAIMQKSFGPVFTEWLMEASKRLDLQCQECGKKFKGTGFGSRCPKCRGVDIDLAESVLQEGNFIKTPADAQKAIEALKKLNRPEARGAIGILKRDWKTVAKNDGMADAILDMIKNSPDYQRWRSSRKENVNEFGEMASGKYRGIIPHHQVGSSGKLPNGFKRLSDPIQKGHAITAAKRAAKTHSYNTYVVQSKDTGKFFVIGKRAGGQRNYY